MSSQSSAVTVGADMATMAVRYAESLIGVKQIGWLDSGEVTISGSDKVVSRVHGFVAGWQACDASYRAALGRIESDVEDQEPQPNVDEIIDFAMKVANLHPEARKALKNILAGQYDNVELEDVELIENTLPDTNVLDIDETIDAALQDWRRYTGHA